MSRFDGSPLKASMSVFRFNPVTALVRPAVTGYRTGTAARLAGIPVATLRIWERRYEVVGPATSAHGHRRYSQEDVSRLALIKSLVDLGHPIGAIAHLPRTDLESLRADAAVESVRPANACAPLRTVLVGPWLAAQGAAGAAARLEVVATCADRAVAAERLRGISAEVLAIDLPALREDAVGSVAALAALVGATRVVVAHRFATQRAASALRDRGCIVVRAPLDLAELASLAATHAEAHDAQPLARAPAPRFDEAALAALANAPTSMICECPAHLAEILRTLGAFERYSADCMRNSPEDAELHRYLERVAGTARTLFEEALVRVARGEGIALPNGV
jgi:DNA-binding transcriptional MerR regulator